MQDEFSLKATTFKLRGEIPKATAFQKEVKAIIEDISNNNVAYRLKVKGLNIIGLPFVAVEHALDKAGMETDVVTIRNLHDSPNKALSLVYDDRGAVILKRGSRKAAVFLREERLSDLGIAVSGVEKTAQDNLKTLKEEFNLQQLIEKGVPVHITMHPDGNVTVSFNAPGPGEGL